jgi:hypothetical protein
MKKRFAIGLALAATLLTSLPARASFTCQELVEFAYGITNARDRGVPQARAEQALDEDPNFSPEDRRAFKRVIEEIYRSPKVNAQAMGTLALLSCEKSGKHKKK